MIKVLIDTSLLIDFKRTTFSSYMALLLAARRKKIKLYTSSIVVFEYWSGSSMTDEKEQLLAKRLFQTLKVLPVSTTIAKHAGALERKDIVQGNDALIAATALEHNAQLATLNARHFKNIPNLKIIGHSIN